MYKIISVLGSVVFLGIYLIWNQQAWTSQVEDLKLENQRLIEEIEILKVIFRQGIQGQQGPTMRSRYPYFCEVRWSLFTGQAVQSLNFVIETCIVF